MLGGPRELAHKATNATSQHRVTFQGASMLTPPFGTGSILPYSDKDRGETKTMLLQMNILTADARPGARPGRTFAEKEHTRPVHLGSCVRLCSHAPQTDTSLQSARPYTRTEKNASIERRYQKDLFLWLAALSLDKCSSKHRGDLPPARHYRKLGSTFPAHYQHRKGF